MRQVRLRSVKRGTNAVVAGVVVVVVAISSIIRLDLGRHRGASYAIDGRRGCRGAVCGLLRVVVKVVEGACRGSNTWLGVATGTQASSR